MAGSALLGAMLHAGERGRVQGLVDTLINFAAGAGSPGSGFLYAALGFNVMILSSLAISLLPCGLIWYMSRGAADYGPAPGRPELIAEP